MTAVFKPKLFGIPAVIDRRYSRRKSGS